MEHCHWRNGRVAKRIDCLIVSPSIPAPVEAQLIADRRTDDPRCTGCKRLQALLDVTDRVERCNPKTAQSAGSLGRRIVIAPEHCQRRPEGSVNANAGGIECRGVAVARRKLCETVLGV